MDPDRSIEKIIREIDGQRPFPEAGEPDSRWKELDGIARMMREEATPEPPADSMTAVIEEMDGILAPISNGGRRNE